MIIYCFNYYNIYVLGFNIGIKKKKLDYQINYKDHTGSKFLMKKSASYHTGSVLNVPVLELIYKIWKILYHIQFWQFLNQYGMRPSLPSIIRQMNNDIPNITHADNDILGLYKTNNYIATMNIQFIVFEYDICS